MNKIKTIIVDVALYANELKLLLNLHAPLFEIVSIYETGEELLKNFENSDFDVLITHVSLPGIKGNELANEIFEKTNKLPYVVFVSGEPTPTITKDIFDANCIIIDFLLRNFDNDRLKQTALRAKTILNKL